MVYPIPIRRQLSLKDSKKQTWIFYAYQEAISLFKDFNVVSLERAYGEKGGGGMMAIINPRLNHMIWESNDDRFQLSKEKRWILIHEGESKLAVGAV